MPFVIERQGRWGDVVAATPEMGLRIAVPRRGFRLVESLQRAIVAFVQPPVSLHRNPELIQLVQGDPAGAKRALENRGVGDVEDVAALAQQSARRARLFAAKIAEINIGPSSETVFLIPRALAVSQQNQTRHQTAFKWASAPRPA